MPSQIERIIPGCPSLMWRTGLNGWCGWEGSPMKKSYLCCAGQEGQHEGDIFEIGIEEMVLLVEGNDSTRQKWRPSWISFHKDIVVTMAKEGIHVSYFLGGQRYNAVVAYSELVEVISIVRGTPYKLAEVITPEKDKEFEEFGAITMLDIE